MRHKRHQPAEHETQTKLVDGDQLARHQRIITVLHDAFCRRATTFDKTRAFKISRLGKLGLNISRREYSRRNTFAAKLFVQRLTKAVHEGLGRKICRLQRTRHKASSRADMQNFAAALFDHIIRNEMRQRDERFHVEIDNTKVRLKRALNKLTLSAKTCVVDQNIHAKAFALTPCADSISTLSAFSCSARHAVKITSPSFDA